MTVLIASGDDPNRMAWGGGKHIHLRLLTLALRTLGHRVLETYPPPPPSDLLFRIRRRAHRMVWGWPRRMELDQLRLVNHFASPPESAYDVVNAHDVIAAVRVPGRVVLTLHGYFARELINYSRFPARDVPAILRGAMAWEAKALDRALAVIAVDSRIAAYVTSEFGYPADRVHVIQNAVDVQTFSPVEPAERARLRASLSVPERAFAVLVPRRLVRKNGVAFALRALRRMPERDVLVCLAGDGPEHDALLAEASGEDRLRVLGTIAHPGILDWYRACDAVLIPSIRADGVEEATSLSMLEGMACARPVVCSAIGGMKEVVRDGDTGLLVEPEDIDGIATALRRLRDDRAFGDRLGAAGRLHVVERHSHLAHAERFARVYSSVLALPPVAVAGTPR